MESKATSTPARVVQLAGWRRSDCRAGRPDGGPSARGHGGKSGDQGRRSVRRNRFRLLLRRLSRPGLQEPGVGDFRKAVVRDFPVLARDACRSFAVATGAGRADRKCPRRGREHHRQSRRKRLPDVHRRGDRHRRRPRAGSDGGSAARGPYAGPGRRGGGGPARMPAAADRKPQRQGRRGVADSSPII